MIREFNNKKNKVKQSISNTKAKARGVYNFKPVIAPSSYVSPAAVIIGRVTLKKNSSIWPGAVLRGDVAEIIIGENSNIQDGVLIHTNINMPVIIGKNVTVGHGVIIHGCRTRDCCLIGMGAILLDGCEVGEWTMVAAGAVVTEGKKLEPESVYMGIPAKRVRGIALAEKDLIKRRANEYIQLAKEYN